MINNQTYKVRYVNLKASSVFNMCGPEHKGPHEWDEQSLIERKKRAELVIQEKEKQNEFYSKLEKSIINDGFRNPILVNAGYCPPRKVCFLPPEMKDDSTKILFCHSNGGSRLWIAKNSI